tara:strand:- start:670 stop:843 length:174 start_codon:yes stop_codon:yes gene_type:complete
MDYLKEIVNDYLAVGVLAVPMTLILGSMIYTRRKREDISSEEFIRKRDSKLEEISKD